MLEYLCPQCGAWILDATRTAGDIPPPLCGFCAEIDPNTPLGRALQAVEDRHGEAWKNLPSVAGRA